MFRKEYTMQDMVESILKMVDLSQQNRNYNDVFRTNACTADAQGKVSICRFLGIDYDLGTYTDDEYHLVGYLMIDGVTLVKNGEINWKAYADAVFDEEHLWCDRKLTTVSRETGKA